MKDESDQDIQRLFAVAGARRRPPEDMASRVHEATMEAWLALPDQIEPELPEREAWRTVMPFALAATLLLVTFIGWGILRQPAPVVSEVGQIAFASGAYTVRGSEHLVLPALGTGALINTSAQGRMLIYLTPVTHLRLGPDTSITLHNNGEIWLHAGRVYIDERGGAQVKVITPWGVGITDIGTRFEVRHENDTLEVAVREGAIDVALPSQTIGARAQAGTGVLLHITADMSVERNQLSTVDERWNWIQQSYPPFELNHGTVHDFVNWAAQETGLELRFENQLVEQQALTATTLRGPAIYATDLTKNQIAAILETTRSFRVLPGDEHVLVIGFAN
ncbi:MAG: FecR family protein [Proteobacteria bacterium]|nr:FecR family protein [Pseudomonadota bacterium]